MFTHATIKCIMHRIRAIKFIPQQKILISRKFWLKKPQISTKSEVFFCLNIQFRLKKSILALYWCHKTALPLNFRQKKPNFGESWAYKRKTFVEN